MHPHWEIRHWFTLPLFLPSSRSSANLIRRFARPSCILSVSSSALLLLHHFSLFILSFTDFLYRFCVSLLLTDWARYLLPAATAAKLKARTRVHFLRAAFYTVHYNARACTHYTVPRDSLPADPAGLAWENTETIIVYETYDARYWRRARSRINANAQAAFMIAVRLYRSISSFGHSAAFGLRPFSLSATICNHY